MPIMTKTVTPTEMETIARLNEDSKRREQTEYRRTIGTVCHEPAERGQTLCDACQCRIKDRCYNVVVTGLESKLTIQQPLTDVTGSVVLRYHDRCYPKNLFEKMSGRGANPERVYNPCD